MKNAQGCHHWEKRRVTERVITKKGFVYSSNLSMEVSIAKSKHSQELSFLNPNLASITIGFVFHICHMKQKWKSTKLRPECSFPNKPLHQLRTQLILVVEVLFTNY